MFHPICATRLGAVFVEDSGPDTSNVLSNPAMSSEGPVGFDMQTVRSRYSHLMVSRERPLGTNRMNFDLGAKSLLLTSLISSNPVMSGNVMSAKMKSNL